MGRGSILSSNWYCWLIKLDQRQEHERGDAILPPLETDQPLPDLETEHEFSE